jgi:hypothetical protein
MNPPHPELPHKACSNFSNPGKHRCCGDWGRPGVSGKALLLVFRLHLAAAARAALGSFEC